MNSNFRFPDDHFPRIRALVKLPLDSRLRGNDGKNDDPWRMAGVEPHERSWSAKGEKHPRHSRAGGNPGEIPNAFIHGAPTVFQFIKINY